MEIHTVGTEESPWLLHVCGTVNVIEFVCLRHVTFLKKKGKNLTVAEHVEWILPALYRLYPFLVFRYNLLLAAYLYWSLL